jgi:hypothetical protein
MSDAPPPILDGGQPPAGERRALTPDELKQIDAMLGLGAGPGGGPTLIRRDDTTPTDAHHAPARLLQTVVVAIILLSIVAAALYVFR